MFIRKQISGFLKYGNILLGKQYFGLSVLFSDVINNVRLSLPTFITSMYYGYNESHVVIKCHFSLCRQNTVLHCTSEQKYTTPGVFWRGWGRCRVTRVGQYLPRKCSCATCQGPEGLRGQSPDPETRESHPLQAGRQRIGRWRIPPHNRPQPITNQHGGEDERTWKQTNENEREKKLKGNERRKNVERKNEEKRWACRAPETEKMNTCTGHWVSLKRRLLQKKKKTDL